MRSGSNCGIMPAVRGNLKQYAIGAAGGAVASAAIVALYLVATANARGADGGDWLAFAGVFFGVMATIGGTRWLEKSKEREAKRAVKAALGAAVDHLRTTLNQFPENPQKGRALADIKQQVAYIVSLSNEVSQNAWFARLALHEFGFYMPDLLNALNREVTGMEPAEVRQARMVDICNAMHTYAHKVGNNVGRF